MDKKQNTCARYVKTDRMSRWVKVGISREGIRSREECVSHRRKCGISYPWALPQSLTLSL